MRRSLSPRFAIEPAGAVTDERVRTGRPVLEVRIRSYESANPPDETILLAHFATFAESTEHLQEAKSRG